MKGSFLQECLMDIRSHLFLKRKENEVHYGVIQKWSHTFYFFLTSPLQLTPEHISVDFMTWKKTCILIYNNTVAHWYGKGIILEKIMHWSKVNLEAF